MEQHDGHNPMVITKVKRTVPPGIVLQHAALAPLCFATFLTSAFALLSS